MTHTIAEIADALGLSFQGDGGLHITSVAEPAQAQADQLALAMRPDFAEGLRDGQAQAAMMWDGADWQGYGLRAVITSQRPRFAMAGLSAMMDLGQGYVAGIHPSAVIDPSAVLGAEVSVGPLAVIGARAEIGAGSVIGPQAQIGTAARIGAGAVIHAGVRIGARVTIGARFIAQPGAVVGADGFSFVTPEPSGVEKARASLGAEGTDDAQSWARIHSLGGVTIGDDVELGANSCIDRGTVRDTRVGNGCKFDNLVQIGHNVVIGNDCLICAQVGVAGSTVIGNNVVLGGQSGVSDNLRIGDRAILGGASVVLSNVPEGRVMLGYPAVKMETHVESYKGLRRLPRLFRDVADLKKAVSKLAGND
ncbi:UDP-3-O-(3-hydroxymyristoyl)glucosamine N-acyltransferase [Tropicibacter naphthalenivorans]|uniref:UDP-3-O-acylglucosamine N-acyltransferase n=1 Tax=Tropicibacter naphthalenivorans TaxID=441103 RepID=A0A0P1GWC1_9RHOB|nr:UDP-3-O-(3-hydroxymyristoyl)glucosamine N-acyltransferase [Tropicibacter naphthalenivorans]CUH80443.1 UDP-3-O-acylglucosamine N-acyltransferase [Tropicibacter naphthalenivorans]SMC86334.1 UDP-3-O-[3-hydroxymyristoyl] glucosamine N-acyltransferase [Tropicibacter naphthalenivorans]